jgi:hypothetical protein
MHWTLQNLKDSKNKQKILHSSSIFSATTVCTMNHAKTSFSTEICAGAIIRVVQYLGPLRYIKTEITMPYELLDKV